MEEEDDDGIHKAVEAYANLPGSKREANLIFEALRRWSKLRAENARLRVWLKAIIAASESARPIRSIDWERGYADGLEYQAAQARRALIGATILNNAVTYPSGGERMRWQRRHSVVSGTIATI